MRERERETSRKLICAWGVVRDVLEFPHMGNLRFNDVVTTHAGSRVEGGLQGGWLLKLCLIDWVAGRLIEQEGYEALVTSAASVECRQGFPALPVITS